MSFSESYRYRAHPSDAVAATALEQIDGHRQLRNHARHQYEQATYSEKPSAYDQHKQLTAWRKEYDEFRELNSKASQRTITQIHRDLETLDALAANGHDVGTLNWKAPREFRSVTYNQSGFKLLKKSGQTHVHLNKIGDIPIIQHRPIPNDADIKEVALKHEPTGDWYVSFSVERDVETDVPETSDINPSDCVGIDLGINTFIHDPDGREINRLDLTDDRERLEREQRSLSRKQRGSNNWSEQRRRVAGVHASMTAKKHDFKHKIAHFYTTTYDAVFLEDLNVTGLMQGPGSARNTVEVGWRDLITIFEHHGRKNGCHVETVPPEGTTKQCASCGVSVEKPLWVREHQCPSCGFESDRDLNAAANVLKRGLEQLGVGHSELTPAETATAVSTDGGDASVRVDASGVVESGSPAIKETVSPVG